MSGHAFKNRARLSNDEAAKSEYIVVQASCLQLYFVQPRCLHHHPVNFADPSSNVSRFQGDWG